MLIDRTEPTTPDFAGKTPNWGHLTITCENRGDAKLLGVLHRLILCGTTPRSGLQELLDHMFASCKTEERDL